jgi:xanthine/uracil permease
MSATDGERARRWRWDREELAGSLGDLGTFLPLLVAMSAQCGLSFPAALFFAGAFNVVTAFTFGIPMAVQPMKAIAAIALAEGLGAGEIVAAGMWVSAVVLVLGLSGALGWIQRTIPTAVVRGLQLALALSLLMRGLKSVSPGAAPWASDGLGLAVLAGLAVLFLRDSRRVPAALVLFLAGIAIAWLTAPEAFAAIRLAPWWPALDLPSTEEFRSAWWSAAFPQVPLTLLNSVVAVCAQGGGVRGTHESARRSVRCDAHVSRCGWPRGPASLRRSDGQLDPRARRVEDAARRAVWSDPDGRLRRVPGEHPRRDADGERS